MHMRISWGRLKPGRWDEYEREFKKQTRREAVKGLKARYLVRDTTRPDAGFAITVWSSARAMQAYDGDGAAKDKRLAPFRPFFTGEFTAHLCEVRVAKTYD
jgi:heme-degrading monooxygenase HmoA